MKRNPDHNPLSLAIAAALYDRMPQGMDVAMFRVQLWVEYGVLL